MSYEAWRVSYQSSEQAARAAWDECERLREAAGAYHRVMECLRGMDMPPTKAETNGMRRAAYIAEGSTTLSAAVKQIRREALRIDSIVGGETTQELSGICAARMNDEPRNRQRRECPLE